jgi:hypothetical protein
MITARQFLQSRSSSFAVIIRSKPLRCALLLALSLLLTATANAQQPQSAPAQASKHVKASSKNAAPVAEPVSLEPKALEILKAACDRLAAAHSMEFTAVVTYENPSRLGPPLAYTTKSEVTMERPDKLRVITLGDGPPSQFYYDGKTMMAFAPVENLVAIAPAPPTIDAALEEADHAAAIYFPFSDVIVADPYKDIAQGLRLAFYIGQSVVVGGTTTDMVAYANDNVFLQIWIGTDDRLPRMLRAVFRNDPSRLRNELDLTDWKIDPEIPADAFSSSKAAAAKRIAFARPDPWLQQGMKRPPRAKHSKTP